MPPELTRVSAIATQAGALLRERFGKRNQISKKEDDSFVSEADMLAHTFLIEQLVRAFPGHKTLSEEQPDALRAQITEDPTWVIDPLDGTSNFIAGIPLFGVALALVQKGRAEMGVIYDPIHNELFAATRGAGAWLNHAPIHVSQKDSLNGAMLFAGRGYKDKHRTRHANIISATERQTTYFRRLGTATLMLAYVAAGRADSVILTGNNPWDTLAGALLVEEAGGRISDYCGNQWTHKSEDLVATNGFIHEPIVAITSVINESCA